MIGRRSVVVLPPLRRRCARYILRMLVGPFLRAGMVGEQPLEIYIDRVLIYSISLYQVMEIRREILGDRIPMTVTSRSSFWHTAAVAPHVLDARRRHARTRGVDLVADAHG